MAFVQDNIDRYNFNIFGVMHPRDSIFTGVKIVDYRNGRYQGLFESQAQKRQGMGILIDDDMNIYCSEWEDNRMNGFTFIYFANGNYFYGMWRGNEPHGINIYRNKEFILIGVYHKGSNVGNTLAITDSINHMLVFSGQQIGAKGDRRKEFELMSSENIVEINYFQDIIYQTAGKNSIQLSKRQVSLVNFLSGFAQKYQQYIRFQSKNKQYYFGFQNGLGFRFSLQGKVNHRINLISIGMHEQGQRISDFGKKYHQSRCIEQGNFSLKQTITYNRTSQRPRQKCIAIYQKNHKKGLNFINQYYEYKGNLIANIELFLINQLHPKHQDHLKRQFQVKRMSKPQLALNKQGDIDHRLSIFQKISAKDDKKRQLVENKQLNRLRENKSTSVLNRKQSKLNHDNYRMNKLNQSKEYQQYHQIQGQLSHPFKRETLCERCKSKQRRSREKSIKLKKTKPSPQNIRSKSKSENKIVSKNVSQKQLKYLINYKQPQKLKQQLQANKQKTNLKSFTNILKKADQQLQRQKIRRQNENKIREQLLNQEIQREVREYHFRQYPPFLQLSGSLNSHPPTSSVLDFSPSSRKLQQDHSIRQNADSNTDSIKKIELLQNRRSKILREFKELNISITNEPQKKYSNNQMFKKRQETKASPLRQTLKYKQALDERERILQFNKKYRNYLQSETSNIENQLQYAGYMQHPAVRSPYIHSFIYTPPRKDYHPSQQILRKSRQKRYEYFFQSPNK